MSEALRLTFEYVEDRIDLVSVQRLSMRVPPPSGPRPPIGGSPAVELRDGAGQVLYRRVATVVPDSVEHPTGDPHRPWAHGPAPDRGVSSVLVPVHSRGRLVAVVGVPRGAREREASVGESAALVDLTTVPLADEHHQDRTNR